MLISQIGSGFLRKLCPTVHDSGQVCMFQGKNGRDFRAFTNGLMTDESVSLPVRKVQSLAETIRNNVGRVIIGKRDIIDLLLVALLSDGHVLIEDVPGIGKTMMAKSLARSLGATFQRVQGTPDLLPTDITGVSYFDQRRNEFVFRQGPLFTQILLVDEVNRATPRTQSALLEAMAERQVTAERTTMPLPKPFLVIATQNPVELVRGCSGHFNGSLTSIVCTARNEAFMRWDQ
jgi:ATPase family associated with various cellular activities (AAA)